MQKQMIFLNWVAWIPVMARTSKKTIAFSQNLFLIWLCASFWNSNLILDEGTLCQVSQNTWEDSVVFKRSERNHWLALGGVPIYSTMACRTMPKLDVMKGKPFVNWNKYQFWLSKQFSSRPANYMGYQQKLDTSRFFPLAPLSVDRFPVRSDFSRTECFACMFTKTIYAW